MKREYTKPIFIITIFENSDIITTSVNDINSPQTEYIELDYSNFVKK